MSRVQFVGVLSVGLPRLPIVTASNSKPACVSEPSYSCFSPCGEGPRLARNWDPPLKGPWKWLLPPAGQGNKEQLHWPPGMWNASCLRGEAALRAAEFHHYANTSLCTPYHHLCVPLSPLGIRTLRGVAAPPGGTFTGHFEMPLPAPVHSSSQSFHSSSQSFHSSRLSWGPRGTPLPGVWGWRELSLAVRNSEL